MSEYYAIKDTTLTALGDAVRSKTSKYTSGADIGDSEPIYSITLDMSQVNWKGANNNLNYQYDLDFITLLGDKYNYTSRFYYKFEYETNNEKSFSVYIRDSQTNDTMFMSQYMDPSTEGYMAYNKNYTYRLQLNARQSSLDAGDTLTFTLRLWPCDANNMFIGLNKYTPLEMADKVNGLEIIPDEALTVTGNCSYAYAYNRYNWLLEGAAGARMSLTEITNIGFIFNESDKLKFFPDIYMRTGHTHVCSNAFYRCGSLERASMIYGLKPGSSSTDRMFYDCYRLRDFPAGFGSDWIYTTSQGATYGGLTAMFCNCYSLRTLPDAVIRNGWSESNSAYSNTYGQLFYYCASLDEINGLGVSEGLLTSNVFDRTFNYTARLKNMTFAVNEDGTPKTANWKNQTIDFSSYVGWAYNKSYILNYNSGITADKEVKDDATYQALKNDPDWFTTKADYSRYNHDSAVNTINSLPDCSASGGTNTIKFKGAAGALTDGGAINTLTEEEIAVAAAKGWTVSLV